MVEITSTCQKINPVEAIQVYTQLRNKFAEDQLFILESLAGPEADRKKSLIGFNPVFTITFKKNRFVVSGEPAICQAVAAQLTQQSYLKKSEAAYELLDNNAVWQVLRLIEQVFEVDYRGVDTALRFGFFGYLGYDVVRYIEQLPYLIQDELDIPDIVLSIYEGVICLDFSQNQTYLTMNHFGAGAHSAEEILDLISLPVKSTNPGLNTAPAPKAVKTTIDKSTYMERIKQALAHIALGDIYQLQLGQVIEIQSAITPFEVYQRMRALNPSPYMYFTKMQDVTIIGASPELFLRIEDIQFTMRPIAGTIRRTHDPETDEKNKQQLLSDEKELAEHLMLVDLCRNDMGRVSAVNSLDVNKLMYIEQYSHVFHIVSNVVAELDQRHDKYDVIAATFPAGTMTGTPKVRAMELIEQFETTRRGIYAGCIGFIDFRGEMETALCIRTAFHHDDTYYIRASAGAVADSVPEKEWLETISKLSSSYLAITGRELKNENFID